MLRSIRFYSQLVFSLLGLIPKMKKVPRVAEEKGQAAADDMSFHVVKKWSREAMVASGVKVEIEGLEHIPKDRNVLFVGNHLSNFDFLVLLDAIPVPVGFIAKVELKKIPLVATWMDYIHCLFMDRSDMKQQMQIILQGIKQLKEGYSMIVFPEGTRSKTGKMLEFKAGTFKLATKSKEPIVPFTIMGTADVLENNGYRIAKKPVKLVFHPAVDVTAVPKEELGSLHQTVQAIVAGPLEGKA